MTRIVINDHDQRVATRRHLVNTLVREYRPVVYVENAGAARAAGLLLRKGALSAGSKLKAAGRLVSRTLGSTGKAIAIGAGVGYGAHLARKRRKYKSKEMDKIRKQERTLAGALSSEEILKDAQRQRKFEYKLAKLRAKQARRLGT